MTDRPQRIVSLLSSNTEMACALGLADRLVGISHECDWPPEILDRPRVTSTRVDASASSGAIDAQVKDMLEAGAPLYTIDEEALVRLKPDLILTQAQCEVCAVDLGEVEAVVARTPPEARPRVLSFQPDSIEDVLNDMGRIGLAAGEGSRTKAVVSDLRDRIDCVVRTMADMPPSGKPGVLTLEWLDPPMPGGCWTPQLVEMAGGRHLLNPPGVKTRPFEWSQVAGSRADALVLCPCGYPIDKTMGEMESFFDREEVRGLPACEAGRVFVADGSALFNRPGPRLVDTLELLAHLIQPGRARKAHLPCPERMAQRIWRRGNSVQSEPIGPDLVSTRSE